MEKLDKWFRIIYNKAIHSLAFFPALISVGFLGLSIIMLELDAMGVGEKVNAQVSWLTLKEAGSATTIASTVATGIISLMVFSFSMVMVVMNQAAAHMSNRLLDYLLGGRFQKLVLSFYIGTVVSSFVLLSNISGEPDAPVPILSIYFLILLTIIDIFLFVSFLHFITQSIRYEQLIQTIHQKAKKSLVRFSSASPLPDPDRYPGGEIILARQSGYFQGFSTHRLLRICEKENIMIRFLFLRGDYVLRGAPLMEVYAAQPVPMPVQQRIFDATDFYYGQEIDKNPHYGFTHLMETGIRALSPGINDPGTAVFSLNALADLLAENMQNHLPEIICDPAGKPRIFCPVHSFEDLYSRAVLPIWDYGRKDRLIQHAMLHMIKQLRFVDKKKQYHPLLHDLEKDVQAAQAEMPVRFQKKSP